MQPIARLRRLSGAWRAAVRQRSMRHAGWERCDSFRHGLRWWRWKCLWWQWTRTDRPVIVAHQAQPTLWAESAVT